MKPNPRTAHLMQRALSSAENAVTLTFEGQFQPSAEVAAHLTFHRERQP